MPVSTAGEVLVLRGLVVDWQRHNEPTQPGVERRVEGAGFLGDTQRITPQPRPEVKGRLCVGGKG